MSVETLDLKVFIGLQGMNAIAPQWMALAEMAASHYLHLPQWHQQKLRNLNERPDDAVILAYYADDALVAVVPLKPEKVQMRKWGIRLSLNTWVLYQPDEMGVCDATILPQYRTPEFLGRVAEDLKHATSRSWSVLTFKHVCQDSHVYSSVDSALPAGLLAKQSHVSKYLTCESDYDSVLNGYSKKFRRNLRRKEKKLLAAGRVNYRFVNQPEQLPRAFEEFLALEASGWKGKSGTAIAQQSAKKAMYEGLMQGLAPTGHFVIHLLELDGKPIAGQLAIHAGATVYLLKIGYDESYAEVSPGFLLVNELLRKCCDRPDTKRISFVTGVGWVDVWKPYSEAVNNIYFLRYRWLQKVLALLKEGFGAKSRPARAVVTDQ
jgi:CelD/BcsL family acetyltransferase involved in cellulose biosynthesis